MLVENTARFETLDVNGTMDPDWVKSDYPDFADLCNLCVNHHPAEEDQGCMDVPYLFSNARSVRSLELYFVTISKENLLGWTSSLTKPHLCWCKAPYVEIDIFTCMVNLQGLTIDEECKDMGGQFTH